MRVLGCAQRFLTPFARVEVGDASRVERSEAVPNAPVARLHSDWVWLARHHVGRPQETG